MTKFIHKGKVLKNTSHTSPALIEIDDFDIQTSNWHFLASEEPVYDRFVMPHQKQNVEFVIVEQNNTDPKIRNLVIANCQNMVPWAPVVKNPSADKHQIIVHDNILLPKDWFLKVYHDVKTSKYPLKIIAKDRPEVFHIKTIDDAQSWMAPYNKCFPFNNERLFNTFIDQTHYPIETFIGVASGFKPYLFLKNIGYTSATKVFLFDTNTEMLELKKWMHSEWKFDRDSYIEKISKMDCVNQNHAKLWERDQAMFGDIKQDLQDIFNTVQFEFIGDTITKCNHYVQPTGKTVIWWNGVFKYPPYFYNKTAEQVDAEWHDFVAMLSNMSKSLHCYGNDPFRIYYNNIHISHLASESAKYKHNIL